MYRKSVAPIVTAHASIHFGHLFGSTVTLNFTVDHKPCVDYRGQLMSKSRCEAPTMNEWSVKLFLTKLTIKLLKKC